MSALRALVLLSGGLDSVTVAQMMLRRNELGACLIVDYGQPHARWEIPCAINWCGKHAVKALHADVPMLGGGGMRIGHGAAGPRVVPGRNLALISLGVSAALVHGCNAVVVGCNADDAADYPDCRVSFITAANATAMAYGVRILAPLLGMTKRQVVGEALRVGVVIEDTWSCYEPRGPAPCGTCNACRLRAAALST